MTCVDFTKKSTKDSKIYFISCLRQSTRWEKWEFLVCRKCLLCILLRMVKASFIISLFLWIPFSFGQLDYVAIFPSVEGESISAGSGSFVVTENGGSQSPADFVLNTYGYGFLHVGFLQNLDPRAQLRLSLNLELSDGRRIDASFGYTRDEFLSAVDAFAPPYQWIGALDIVATAAPAVDPDQPFVDGAVIQFRTEEEGRFLAVDGNNVVAVDDEDPSTLWKIIEVPTEFPPQVYYIQHIETGKFLDADGRKKGYNVDLNSGVSNKGTSWTFDSIGGSENRFVYVFAGGFSRVLNGDQENVTTTGSPGDRDLWRITRVR